MFERFTDRARQAIVLAQDEARRLNHNYIGTEHLLLGLLRDGNGVAAKALTQLDVSLSAVRRQVEQQVGSGEIVAGTHIPFTPRAKKVLELALREATQLGHNYIGTEHLLLGLLREGEGVAAQVLVDLGADLDRVRQQVVQLLSGQVRDEPGYPDRFSQLSADLQRLERVVGRLTDVVSRLDARLAGGSPQGPASGQPPSSPGSAAPPTSAGPNPPPEGSA
jgi:ATP-dependent Clp protease ATP-binding subunit ClpA